MLKRVKNWLGIEGVKLYLEVPYEIGGTEGHLAGHVVLTSKESQRVEAIYLSFIEKYTRGRRKKKLIDEYKLAEEKIEGPWDVNPDEELLVPFSIPFDLIQSEMDRLEKKNIFIGSVVAVAKKLKGVKSEYRLEAEAVVEGTKLNPFDKKPLKVVR